MTKHFDFDEIGKKTPYRIPDGFFDEMQDKVMQQIEEPRRSRISLKHISYAVMGIAAAACAFIFIPSTTTDVVEQQTASISWVEQISDDDLQAFDEMADYDIFMD